MPLSDRLFEGEFREWNERSGYPSEQQLQILSGHRTRDVRRASTWRNLLLLVLE
jgi:hypothetical protein